MFDEIKQKLIGNICDRQCDLVLSGKKHIDEISFKVRVKDRSLYIMEFRKYHNLATSEDLFYYGRTLLLLNSDISRMKDGHCKRVLQRLYQNYKGGNYARIIETEDIQVEISSGAL